MEADDDIQKRKTMALCQQCHIDLHLGKLD